MKKRLLLRLALLAAVGFAGLWLVLWWTAPTISRENYARIEEGMTKTEVVALLGCRPHFAPWEFDGIGPFLSWRLDETGHVWETPEFRIHVFFDGYDRVVNKAIVEQASKRTFLQKVRRWLRVAGGLSIADTLA